MKRLISAALILFLVYQEWMNVGAVLIIAVVAFAILFSGTFIQVLLEEANYCLKKLLEHKEWRMCYEKRC